MATSPTQRSYRAPCPGCGAPVEFRSAQSTHAVCGYCQSTVVRQGEVLSRIGKMAELFDDHSPLQIGAAGRITLDGSETASVKFAPCCHPIPGDEITGYLERGEGLVVHTADCGIGKNLISRDAERFIEVEWAEQMTRPFAVALTVTAHNRIGAIASITSAIAAVRADIAYINTSDDIMYQTSLDLHLILQVNDRVHLADVLRALRRVPATIRAQRVKSAAS